MNKSVIRFQLQFDAFQTICSKMLLATNGFSSAMIEEDVTPNRAQVLITAPIPNLAIQGTFHMDRGIIILEISITAFCWAGGEIWLSKKKNNSFALNEKFKMNWNVCFARRFYHKKQ